MDLLFTSAGPFITSNTKIRRFIDSTWTTTKNWKPSKRSEVNQQGTSLPSSSKRTVITVLEHLPFNSSRFFLILRFQINFFSQIQLFSVLKSLRNVDEEGNRRRHNSEGELGELRAVDAEL